MRARLRPMHCCAEGSGSQGLDSRNFCVKQVPDDPTVGCTHRRTALYFCKGWQLKGSTFAWRLLFVANSQVHREQHAGRTITLASIPPSLLLFVTSFFILFRLHKANGDLSLASFFAKVPQYLYKM